MWSFVNSKGTILSSAACDNGRSSEQGRELTVFFKHFNQHGSSSLEALSTLMHEGTQPDSVASILESFVTFTSSEWVWILQLEVKRPCQKWDSNLRLHSETRNPSTEEGTPP